ncbi:hypothetical protein A3SAC12_0056 [Lactobacillus phage 3-SAC12]|nr:hypothetical protein A3SAC12_0056 [Lactobacillus phage 3-SAC12]
MYRETGGKSKKNREARLFSDFSDFSDYFVFVKQNVYFVWITCDAIVSCKHQNSNTFLQ